MQLVKRAQHRLPLIIGILLFLTPFIFGIVTTSSSYLAAWDFGAFISVAAVGLALLWWGFARNRIIEGMTVLLGLVLLITPWILSAGWLSAGVLASSLLGIVLMIAVGELVRQDSLRQVAISPRRSGVEVAGSHGYRRVTNSL